MKSRNIILLAASMALALCSCSKKTGDVPVDAPISLSTEAVDFNFGADQSASVIIETEADWNIEGVDDGVKKWLEIDKTSGHGDDVVIVKCIEFNPWNTKRVGVLTFSSGKYSKELVVKQLPDPERSVCLSKDTLYFAPAAGETFNIDVITQKAWTLEESDATKSWLSVTPKSGDVGGSVAIQSTEINEEVEARIEKIGFRIDRVNCAELVLVQPSGIELSIDKDAINFLAAGYETIPLNISSNAKTKEWRIEGVEKCSNWLKFDKTSGIGDAQVNITTLSKNDDVIRKADITIRIDDVHYKALSVTQNSSLEIHLDPKSLTFSDEEAESKMAVVTSTTDKREWYVEGYTDEIKEWLVLDTEKYTGFEKAITLSTLGENRTAKDRVAVLKFHLTPEIYEELTVTQPMIPLETKVLSWTGCEANWASNTKGALTITAFPDQDIVYCPYSTSGPSASLKVTDGKTTNVAYTGSISKSYMYHVVDPKVAGVKFDLEIGPAIKAKGGQLAYYYMNDTAYSRLRVRNFYLKTPVIEGFKLTGVTMDVLNSAATNAVCVTKDLPDQSVDPTNSTAFAAAMKAVVIENQYNQPLGINAGYKHTFTTTEKNKSYYVISTADRLVRSFTFTYSEER